MPASARLGVVLSITCAVVAACGLSELGTAEAPTDAGADALSDLTPPEAADDTGPALDGAAGSTGDGDAGDAESEDAPVDAGDDAPDASDAPTCNGAPLGGYCWYASAPEKSCSEVCLTRGGCNLAGTRDFAGSGGTDANCVAVLSLLGFGAWSHQAFSNNDLGCQFAWASWTYWSSALPTTCEAAGMGAAQVVRMCACNE